MECRDVRPLADSYLTEQLLVETNHAIVSHLEGCSSCRAEFEAQRRLRAATKSAFANTPSLQARPEFLTALAVDLRGHSSAAQPRSQWRGKLALAATVLLVASLGAGGTAWFSEQRLHLLSRLAAGDHQNCAIKFKLEERPITLAAAAVKYEPAFGRLEAVPPAVEQLSAGPLKVLERHACVYNGQPFAHIVLSYKGTAVSLLVADEGATGGAWWRAAAAREMPPAGGFNLETFHSAGHQVFVVSALGADDVKEVAQAMVAPVSAALAGL